MPDSHPRRYLVVGIDDDAIDALTERLVGAGVPASAILSATDPTLPRLANVDGAVAAIDPESGEADLAKIVRDAINGLAMQSQLAAAARDLRLLEAAVDQAQDAMVITDARLDGDGPRIRWANAAFAKLIGADEHDIVGNPLASTGLLHPAKRRLLTSLRRRFAFDGALHVGDEDLGRHLEVSIGPVRSGDRVEHFVGVVRDITEKKRVEDRLLHLAHHDHLTGLPNRKLLRDRLEHAITRARRFEEPLALVFIDLDGFKIINDTLGHAAGDRVLEVVAERLTQTVRASDTVARLGGDEFVLLLPGIGSIENAERVAVKVVECIGEAITAGDQELFTTPSLGVAMWPAHGDDATALLRHADQAMYHAKASGKGTWVTWTPALDAEEHDRAELVADLAEATALGHLHLDATPIWDVTTGEPVAVELAVRWTHPAHGPVAPTTFLPLLGEAGVEAALLDWTVDRIGEARPHTAITIDARPTWLREPDLIERMVDALAERGVAADRVWLEVAEGTLIHLDAGQRDTLEHLRERGVRIVVDHYGTSHLSLPQLRTMPLDAVKLDQELLRRVVDDDALVRGLVTLCQSLGLQVIADGVTTAAQRDALSKLGLTLQKGPLWGPAAPLVAEIDAAKAG